MRTSDDIVRGRRPWRGWILLSLLAAPLSLRAANPDALSLTIRVDPPPAPVQDLTVLSGDQATPDPALAGAVTLAWTEPDPIDISGNVPAGYEVRYSSAGNIQDDAAFAAAALWPQAWTPAPAGSPRVEVVSGLVPGVTFYWALKAVDAAGARGAWDRLLPADGVNDGNFAWASLPLGPADVLAPRAPPGVRVDAAPGGGGVSLTVRWKAPRRNADGTLLSDLSGYEVYRSSVVGAAGTLVLSTTALSYTDLVAAGTVRYYRVRAVDVNGNRSADSAAAEASGDGSLLNVVFLADDAASRVSLPAALALRTLSENNGLGDDLTVAGVRVAAEEGNGVARSVRFDALLADDGAVVPAFSFRPPLSEVVLAYDVLAGQVMQGPSPLLPAAEARRGLALYWFNGLEWLKVGGAVDDVNNVVRLRTGRLGRYQVRRSVRNPSGELVRVYPRAFTPNGDGWNDKAVFVIDNPDGLPVSGEIFDGRGALVAELVPGPSENTLVWDGAAAGRTVPGGMYSYRVEIGGQVKKGTLVVAR